MKFEGNKIFFDIIEIQNYLATLQNTKKRKSYLEFLHRELYNYVEYYTDDNLEKVISESNLDKSYCERIPYSKVAAADFSHDKDTLSDYRKFKRLLRDNLLPFIWRELVKIREIGAEKMNTNTSIVEKINWKGTLTDLVCWIDRMIELKNIEPKAKINKIITEHFIKGGTEIKPNELSDLRSKTKSRTYPLTPSKEISEFQNKPQK